MVAEFTCHKNWVGYLNTILAPGGGNLNKPIFKSSYSKGLPRAQVALATAVR